MPGFEAPPLTRGGLDRDAVTRMSESALQRAWREPGAVLLRVKDGQLLPIKSQGEPGARLDLVPTSGDLGSDHYYLGRADGAPVFACAAAAGDGDAEPDDGWAHPFQASELLTPLQLEIMTVALAIVNWNTTMTFSPRDGETTAPAQGGWARIDEHGGEHFPRTDPAVIVLIEHDDRVLLGSNVLWETGRFSLLAGFVEAGESAEQAVRREVFEESGVFVDDVRYVASQPWPFPRSLMLGFRAKLAANANPDDLVRDETEISELRWFTRDELRRPAPDLKLPMGLSIARWLIDAWVAEDGTARDGTLSA